MKRCVDKKGLLFILSSIMVVLLFLVNLFYGSVDIPSRDVLAILFGGEVEREAWRLIVLETRVPQAVTALLAGAAISVAGLLLQTLFNNPLAGPEVLGINSGAGLGVAVVMLLMQGVFAVGGMNVAGYLALFGGAFAGAAVIMAIILFLSSVLKNKVFLLVVGVAVGYLASSLVSVLNYFATSEGVHSYLVWGMGSFGAVSAEQLSVYAALILLLLVLSLFMMKPLNALLLGDVYAHNLGVNVKAVRAILLAITGMLTAVVTAFCGPISFIGLAVPHLARLMLRTSRHKILIPATMLIGANLALACNLLSTMPHDGSIIPISVITPLIGAPVVLHIILKQRHD